MKKIISLIFIFAFAFANSQITPMPVITFKKSNTIYCFGNSFTSADVFPLALTSSVTAFTRVNYGISGNTTANGIARIRSATIGDAKYAIVELGINDIVGSISSDTIISHLNFICNAFKQAGANVILLNTPPFKTNVNWSAGKQTIQDAVNAACASATATPYADFRVNIKSVLETSPGSNTLSPTYDSGDHLHPNTAGYNIMARAIYTTVGTWTVSSITPTLSLSGSKYLAQNVHPLARPVFKGIILNDSLLMQSNVIHCGNINSSGTWSGTTLFSSNNATVTGAAYFLNNVNLGSLGVHGSITNGGGNMKIISGSTSTNVVLATPAFSNGRFKIENTTGYILIGDVSSMTTNTTGDILQLGGPISTPTIAMRGATPSHSFIPSTSGKSNISFCSSNGTVRGLIDIDISVGDMRIFGMSGGYWPVFGSNGTEAMRISGTQQIGIGTGTTIAASAKLQVTSTTQGFLPPVMTATQASAISSPAQGLLVFVTSTNGTFTSTGWWGFNATWEKLNN